MLKQHAFAIDGERRVAYKSTYPKRQQSITNEQIVHWGAIARDNIA